MKIKHLFYSIALGVSVGLALGVLVYTVPALAQTKAHKLATDLTETSCHHDQAEEDCGCDSCESSDDCEACPECSGSTDESSNKDSSKGSEEAIGCSEVATSCSIEG